MVHVHAHGCLKTFAFASVVVHFILYCLHRVDLSRFADVPSDISIINLSDNSKGLQRHSQLATAKIYEGNSSQYSKFILTFDSTVQCCDKLQ